MTFLKHHHPRLSLVRQYDLLGWPLLSKENALPRYGVTLMNEIPDLHETFPMYGYRKIHAVFKTPKFVHPALVGKDGAWCWALSQKTYHHS